MEHWTEHTCIEFEETTDFDQPHLEFIKDGGCYSFVGVSSSTGQPVSIADGCFDVGYLSYFSDFKNFSSKRLPLKEK